MQQEGREKVGWNMNVTKTVELHTGWIHSHKSY